MQGNTTVQRGGRLAGRLGGRINHTTNSRIISRLGGIVTSKNVSKNVGKSLDNRLQIHSSDLRSRRDSQAKPSNFASTTSIFRSNVANRLNSLDRPNNINAPYSRKNTPLEKEVAFKVVVENRSSSAGQSVPRQRGMTRDDSSEPPQKRTGMTGPAIELDDRPPRIMIKNDLFTLPSSSSPAVSQVKTFNNLPSAKRPSKISADYHFPTTEDRGTSYISIPSAQHVTISSQTHSRPPVSNMLLESGSKRAMPTKLLPPDSHFKESSNGDSARQMQYTEEAPNKLLHILDHMPNSANVQRSSVPPAKNDDGERGCGRLRFCSSNTVRSSKDTPSLPHSLSSRLGDSYGTSNIGYHVVVSNLGDSVSEEDIVELFSFYGRLKSGRLFPDNRAEIVFVNLNDAQSAVDNYDGRDLDGYPMKVELLKGKSTIPHVDLDGPTDIGVLHKVLFGQSSEDRLVSFNIKL